MKISKEKEPAKPLSFINFWFAGCMIAVLLVFNLGRDIDRPFYGLHSWGAASGAWAARSHYEYGFGYTHFMTTWAVGNPPTQNPSRYLDHPQLSGIVATAAFAIFGVNERAPRIFNLFTSVLALLLFLKIVRKLIDEKTALLAGLLYAIFPLTCYFGTGSWIPVTGFWAIWCYLVLIGAIKTEGLASKWYKIGLAVSLFLTLQFGWPGFFWAFAIGVHYVARCAVWKIMPQIGLLSILVIAPLSSLALNFLVMAQGYGWDVEKIVSLYKWRSAKGEMAAFHWGAWFAKFWEFALTNFTAPILIAAIAYLVFGQVYAFCRKQTEESEFEGRRFSQYWLFMLIPVSQLLILRGQMWKHQFWEMPCGPVIAIAAASGVMLLWDVLKTVNRKVAAVTAAAVVGCIAVFCLMGANYYYDIRWQPVEKINMFKQLNAEIPSDKSLLSFEDFIVNQNEAKGGFYRPEIAWYLDREIVSAQSLADIEKLAATGEYPYYLILQATETMPLINELAKKYKYEYVAGVEGESKSGKPLRAGMMPYFIFDLQSVKK